MVGFLLVQKKLKGVSMELQSNVVQSGQSFPAVGVDLDELSSVIRRRILIIDDDPDAALLLKRILILGGFDVANALTGQEGLEKLEQVKPDMILLDLRMPELDGWETFQRLRQVTSSPVIVVSADNAKDNIVRALQDGVDDYITKPFYNPEVVARVKSVLRRAEKPEDTGRFVFQKAGLVIDLLSQEVMINNRKLSLTPKEFAVLVILAKHAPAIVHYQEITLTVWNENSIEAHNRTKYLVYLIRRKFAEAAPDKKLILNVDRNGYKLNVE
jgi:two-component system KDP operon response regulator KdpE